MRGWSKVGTSTKFHYFEFEEGKTGGVSLCNKWMLLNTSQHHLDDSYHEHVQNCKACIKKLKKMHPDFFQERQTSGESKS